MFTENKIPFGNDKVTLLVLLLLSSNKYLFILNSNSFV